MSRPIPFRLEFAAFGTHDAPCFRPPRSSAPRPHVGAAVDAADHVDRVQSPVVVAAAQLGRTKLEAVVEGAGLLVVGAQLEPNPLDSSKASNLLEPAKERHAHAAKAVGRLHSQQHEVGALHIEVELHHGEADDALGGACDDDRGLGVADLARYRVRPVAPGEPLLDPSPRHLGDASGLGETRGPEVEFLHGPHDIDSVTTVQSLWPGCFAPAVLDGVRLLQSGSSLAQTVGPRPNPRMRNNSVEPKHLKILLFFIAFLYLLFPRDLIPDFFGTGLGLIDDLLLMVALHVFYRKRLADFVARTAGESAQAGGETHRQKTQQSDRAFDPYQILGIPMSSSRETIRSAYRSRMTEYHPDKVAHLGEELQELAHQKVLEIQKAYQQLTK